MEGVLASILAFANANPTICTFVATLLVNHGIKIAPIKSNSIPELIGNVLASIGTSVAKATAEQSSAASVVNPSITDTTKNPPAT